MKEMESLRCSCFRIRRASRAITQAYEAIMAPSEVSPVQMTILAEIDRGAEEQSINFLANQLGTDRTTLSRSLDRLVMLGWIFETKTSDNRKRSLALSPLGKQKLIESIRYWRRAESKLLSAFGSDHIDKLYQTLEKIESISHDLNENIVSDVES